MRPDWFDRWHASFEKPEVVDAIVVIRLLLSFPLILGLCYAWARLWSASIVR
jgi:hypothetical protein